MENADHEFLTIRRAAETGVLPEYQIRSLVANKVCPGFYIGNRFYVDVTELRRVLLYLARKNIKIESYREKLKNKEGATE